MDAPNKANKENFNNSYDNANHGKGPCLSDYGRNPNEMNDNLSEKANSVQTSYKYKKNKNGPTTISSKDSNHYRYNNYQINEEDSYEISDNDNLICPNCINETLIEDKQRREELEREREKQINRMYDYGNDYNNALIDKNRNYDKQLIDEKRRQREYNTNEAIQNLAKINAGLSNKDKLIQLNENSRNPLNEGYPDYQYQKFRDEYDRRQKMINDNINKYYPNINNQRPEISSYYENYVNNPNYDKNRKNKIYDDRERERDYGPYGNNDKKEYLRILEEQINYKNELKKREKEEDRRRGQRQYEEIQKELQREEQERRMKEQRQKDELIRGNLELMNQKLQLKNKELEEKLKYKELCDKQNEDYIKELEKQKLEREKYKDEIYNQNKNDYETRQKNKLLEKEREKIRPYYDNNDYEYPKRKYDKRYDDKDYNEINNRQEPIDKYNNKKYEKNKYGERYMNEEGNNDYKDYRDKNRDNKGHYKVKERMGRCCRCHRIFPRKLLSINKYFYKENRV